MLFELLIGLCLTALLLSCLFSFWVGSVKVEAKLQNARTEVLARAALQTRLQSIFTTLVPGDSFYTQEFPHEEQDSLIALFDNGIDPDPAFSGPILARIYIDEEQNLALALWPKEETKDRNWRKEILLPHTPHIEWEFLGAKRGLTTPQKKRASVRPINASLEWRANWPEAAGELPALIRLCIEQKNSAPLRFAFRIPASSATPTYIQGVKA